MLGAALCQWRTGVLVDPTASVCEVLTANMACTSFAAKKTLYIGSVVSRATTKLLLTNGMYRV